MGHSHSLLGELNQLTLQGRYAEVISLCDQADVSTETLFYKANALYGLEDLILSESFAKQALTLSPTHHPSLTLLASIANLRGDSTQARSWLLNVDPNGVDLPETRLEMGLVLLKEKNHRAAIELMDRSMASFTHAMHRARAAQILGDCYDALGDFQTAFGFYCQKNEQLKLWMQHLGVSDQLNNHARMLLDSLSAWPSFRHTQSDANPRPIFIVGFPRTGTTLLQAKLSNIPDTDTLDERNLWTEATERWLSNPQSFQRLLSASDRELSCARESFWNHATKHLGRSPRKIIIDKFPLNALKLPLISKVFPGASVIYCTRNPRASVFSAFRRFIKPSALTLACCQLDKAAELHQTITTFVKLAEEKLDLNIFTLSYEEWMNSPEATFTRLCEQLALPTPTEQSTEEWQRDLKRRPYATPSSAQIFSGITSQFQHNFKPYDFALDAFFKA